MKRGIVFLLVICMLFALTGCGGGGGGGNPVASQNQTFVPPETLSSAAEIKANILGKWNIPGSEVLDDGVVTNQVVFFSVANNFKQTADYDKGDGTPRRIVRSGQYEVADGKILTRSSKVEVQNFNPFAVDWITETTINEEDDFIYIGAISATGMTTYSSEDGEKVVLSRKETLLIADNAEIKQNIVGIWKVTGFVSEDDVNYANRYEIFGSDNSFRTTFDMIYKNGNIVSAEVSGKYSLVGSKLSMFNLTMVARPVNFVGNAPEATISIDDTSCYVSEISTSKMISYDPEDESYTTSYKEP